MRIFIQSGDYELWKVVVNDLHISIKTMEDKIIVKFEDD